MSEMLAGVQAIQQSDPLMNQISFENRVTSSPERSFGDFLIEQIEASSTRIQKADLLSTSLATGQPIPSHQVMIALEDAKIQLQLALQVRNKLLEGYQELARMQI